MYRLIEFTGEQEYIDLFLSVPTAVYNRDQNYIPERKKEVLSWLLGTHTCIKFLKHKNLVVLHNNIPVARGIVFINNIGKFGSIGFFEFMNNVQAVKLLVDEAKTFCRENNVKTIYAPMNGSIWSNYRLMTNGFEDKPFLGEPYNKPYYNNVLTKCGFKIIKRWETQFVKKVSVKGNTAVRYLDLEKSQHTKGIKIRSMWNFNEDIRIIHKLAMNSFSDFFLFHELNEQDFVDIYGDMKPICDKRTIKIAYDQDNKPIGFGIALPDYRSKLGFLLRYAKRYIFLYIGTLQEDGESVYPQCGKAIIVPILKSLYFRRKGYICAMMSEDAKTRGFSKEYENVREYALLELEVD